MSYLLPNYVRKPFELVTGDGCTLHDDQGRTFLDFTSGIGVVNLGYGDPEIEQALIDQSLKIWHTPNLYQNHLQEEVAKLLCESYDYRAFFCNSGAEANEAALKFVRKATKKSEIVTCLNSFHGRTYGAMSATGQVSVHKGFHPLVPGFSFLEYNNYAAIDQRITTETAGVLLELIQGEGGVQPAERAWIKQVAARCEAVGALFVIDEIQTGIGRTGTFYAFEQYGVIPDVVTLAKGLGNGFPVGAMLAKNTYQEAFSAGSHGTTFGGNKLAMAVAKVVIEKVKQSGFLLEVQRKGHLLAEELKQLPQDKIKEIRGTGLMWGIELTDEYSIEDVLDGLADNGLLALKAGKNVIRLLPPLILTEEELHKGVQILATVLKNNGK
ncbi:MAG: acetylornithine transaminase [Enterococcus sp.]